MAHTPPVAVRPCPGGCGPLTTFSFRGIALEGCADCAGVWLDPGEYRKLCDLPEAALQTLEDEVRARHHPAPHPERTRPCPQCRALMTPLVLHAGVTVTLDRCGLCNGLWADDGELETLAHALRDKPAFVFSHEVAPETAYTIGLATMDYLDAQQVHRLSLFQSVCAWIQQPRVSVS